MKNPTNADIMKLLQPLIKDVQDLKQWRRDQDIAKAAVAEYVQAQPAVAQNTTATQGSEQILNQQLVKYLGAALAIILALITLFSQLKGLK